MKSVWLSLLLLLCLPSSVAAADVLGYQRDNDLYRADYALFEVKRGAFTQTQTFAAEEALIEAARVMLLSRADVWTSYWQLLATRITNLPGMQAKYKDPILKDLESEIETIQAHKARLEAAETRAELLTEAQFMNIRLETYQALTFLIHTELVSNTLLHGAQSLLEFNDNVTTRVRQQQLTEGEKTTKLRGLAVSAERVDQLVSTLFSTRITLLENASRVSESVSKITEAIGPLYPELQQQLQTTIELAKGVEW
jgi:hypothetical protein